MNIQSDCRDGKRTAPVADHEAFLKALLTANDLAEIDAELDERIVCDPYNDRPPGRRSDRELNRVLNILDTLKGGANE
jgi:hypothetical protein